MKHDYKEIGETLSKARRKKEIELADLAEATKIAERYLAAIEDGDIGVLPSMVYYRLFTRTYAREMGLEPDTILPEPENDRGAPGAEEKPTPEKSGDVSRPPERPGKKGTSLVTVGIIMAAVVMVVFIVVVLYFSGKDGQEETGQTGVETPPVMVEPETLSTAERTPTATDEKPVGPAYAPGGPMTLTMTAVDSCWVRVVSDGDTVMDRTLRQGVTRQVKANYRFNLSLGKPLNVRLYINDTLLAPLSASGLPAKEVEINQSNRKQFYAIEE